MKIADRSALALLSERVRREASKVLGIRQLTPVQEATLPVILRGYNALIISPSGTGKTEAAMLPILDSLLREREAGIQVLYITPLRALNRDILRRISSLADVLGLRIEVRHGDTSDYIRRRQALRPPDIMITTPETLQAILVGRVIREHLRGLRFVVIDEIHELIDSKRGVQLLLALERLRAIAREDFQRIGLSATIGNPGLVAKYLQGSSRRPMKIIDVRTAKKYLIQVDYVEKPQGFLNVDHLRLPEEVVARLEEIVKELRRWRAILIFTNTRETAELLASRLKLMVADPRVSVHHSSLSKEERVQAEEGLKRGELKAIVCTSSLELGIDIGSIDFVIQYASPRRATTLIQRVGRAGHRVEGIARGKILAVSIDEILESAVLAKMALSGDLEEPVVHDEALDVLAHQIVGIVLENREGVALERIFDLVRRARPYRSLDPETLFKVVKQLESEGKIRLENGIVRKTRETWRYYFENISTIPDVVRYKVIDFVTGREVGELDEEFIAMYGKEGQDFVLAGRVWRILSIDPENRKVIVEPSGNIEAAIPAWVGELIPVPFRCAVEVFSIRRRLRETLLRGSDPEIILRKYPLSKRALEKVIDFFRRVIAEREPVPHDKLLVIEEVKDLVIIHTPLGSRGNYGLGVLLSHQLSQRLLASVSFRSDPYRIVLRGAFRITAKEVSSLIRELANMSWSSILQLLEEAICNTDAFKWRLYNVAKRFGFLRRDSSYGVLTKRIINLLTGTPIYMEALRETKAEKIDEEAIRWLFSRLSRGIMSLLVIKRDKPSPFAEPILSRYFHDIVPYARPVRLLLEAVKERLLSSEVRLICLHCACWESVRTIKYLPEDIKCPICGSRLVAAVDPRDEEIKKVIRRAKRGAKLSKEEKEKLKRAQESAILVLNYGRRALLALAARGVGPKTAMRILREIHGEDEQKFYARILEAERQFFRTRRFWA